MRQREFVIFSLVLSFFISSVSAQEGRRLALLIGVGDYQELSPPEKGFSDISSAYDVQLLSSALRSNNFEEPNITTLVDAEATKANIIKAFQEFEAKLNTKDNVFIHFSGHGQQMWDANGDEIDGLDEAFCCFDAKPKFVEGQYEGNGHLSDDEIEEILKGLCSKVGSKGSVLVSFDSCFSGTANRGFPLFRGWSESLVPYGYAVLTKETNEPMGLAAIPSNLVVITASSSFEKNRECYDDNKKVVGSLTYNLVKALNRLDTQEASCGEVFSHIYNGIKKNVFSRNQTPTFTGKRNQKVFSGEDFIDSGVVPIYMSHSEVILNVGAYDGMSLSDTFTMNLAGEKHLLVPNSISPNYLSLEFLRVPNVKPPIFELPVRVYRSSNSPSLRDLESKKGMQNNQLEVIASLDRIANAELPTGITIKIDSTFQIDHSSTMPHSKLSITLINETDQEYYFNVFVVEAATGVQSLWPFFDVNANRYLGDLPNECLLLPGAAITSKKFIVPRSGEDQELVLVIANHAMTPQSIYFYDTSRKRSVFRPVNLEFSIHRCLLSKP